MSEGCAAQPPRPAAGGGDLRTAAMLLVRGRDREAVALCTALLAERGDDVETLHVAGVAAAQCGELAAARYFVERALALGPGDARLHNSLGNVLAKLGDEAGAEASYRAAVALDPAYAHGWFNLGNRLRTGGDSAAAEAAYRRAVELAPDDPDGWQNLGAVLVEQGRLEAAEAAFRRVLDGDPNHPGALNNLAACRLAAGDAEAALATFERAIAAHPEFVDAHVNLGDVHRADGRLGEAIEAYRNAAGAAPERYQLHFNLGVTMLLAGVFDEGWREYEWRWRNGGAPAKKAGYEQPVWDGSSFAGRRLLITGEQGLGDQVQFIRYAALAKRLGGAVYAEARPPLARLFATSRALDAVVPDGEAPPPFDLQVPLLSLPGIFGTDLDTIPAEVPYLEAAPAVRTEAAAALAAAGDDLKVGLAWAGSLGDDVDPRRTVPLACLRPLAAVPGVRLFNLQFGARGEALADHPELGVVDLGPWLGDFHHTGAIVERLDLVITADASVAHLAGALARPVWTLLAFLPDWRWLLDRDDTPWYPTMRLFRQRRPGDWEELVERVAAALGEKVARRG